MTKERVEKAVEIINYAIKNQISVKEASVKNGFADTYVKNIKAILLEKYENGTIQDELFTLFFEAYDKYSTPLPEKYNIITETKKPNDIPTTPKGEDTKYNESGNEATIEWKSGSNYPPDHIKTVEELLKATNVDLKLWKVAQQWLNKWDVTAIVDGIPRTFQNYQVKVRLEKIIDSTKIINEKAVGEIFIEMTKNYKPPLLANIPKYNTTEIKDGDNNLLEISIFDLHLGKLAWGGETGENFDTKIARERFLTAIETLLLRASGFQYSRILFPVGNDFFNSDNIYNTTTKGTPQDEDLRWQKTFSVGIKLLVDAINLLKQARVPVDIVNIPGNHDFERSFYMGSVLEAWFRNDKQISVNNGASPRKYYRFGKVLLGLTHGSEEKESSLPMLMAIDTESKPMWSETLYHEWHIGHIHRKRDVKYTILDKTRQTNEDLGVIIRYLSSLTGTEEWHHKKGFVGSTKAADAFVWNDEFGLIAQLNTNLIITE